MITVMFDCQGCGLKQHKVQVPAREGGEDLGVWMDKLKQWLADEHKRVSPSCTTEKCDLYLPVKDAEFIGQQIE